MGLFPSAVTLWSPMIPWQGWRLYCRPPEQFLSRRTPLARFLTYIHRIAFARIPLRAPSSGGLWVASTIERGPPGLHFMIA
jgi:hypothetical protein